MLPQKFGHVAGHPVRMVQMDVVIAADHGHGHVRPAAVELVRVPHVRGVTAAVLVSKHVDGRARDVGQDLLVLIERHQRINGQLEPLVAGESVLVDAAGVHLDQTPAGQRAR